MIGLTEKDWQNAFQPVRAEGALKENTKSFLKEYETQARAEKLEKYRKPLWRRAQAIAAVCAAALLLTSFWGLSSRQAEAAYITLDSVPKIGLSVNHWDQVISVHGLNEAGTDVISQLKLTGINYREAVQRILNSEIYEEYESADTQIEVDVSSDNEELKSNMEAVVYGECENHKENHGCGTNNFQKDNQNQEDANEVDSDPGDGTEDYEGYEDNKDYEDNEDYEDYNGCGYGGHGGGCHGRH